MTKESSRSPHLQPHPQLQSTNSLANTDPTAPAHSRANPQAQQRRRSKRHHYRGRAGRQKAKMAPAPLRNQHHPSTQARQIHKICEKPLHRPLRCHQRRHRRGAETGEPLFAIPSPPLSKRQHPKPYSYAYLHAKLEIHGFPSSPAAGATDGEKGNRRSRRRRAAEPEPPPFCLFASGTVAREGDKGEACVFLFLG